MLHQGILYHHEVLLMSFHKVFLLALTYIRLLTIVCKLELDLLILTLFTGSYEAEGNGPEIDSFQ